MVYLAAPPPHVSEDVSDIESASTIAVAVADEEEPDAVTCGKTDEEHDEEVGAECGTDSSDNRRDYAVHDELNERMHHRLSAI